MAITEKKVLILLADGCEEIEAVTVIDLLRRAKITVVAAGLHAGTVAASRGVNLVPDSTLDDVLGGDFDMVVLPGGAGGADRLEQDARIKPLLKKMAADGRYVAAICAAPKVLVSAGLLDGRKATSYPGFIDNEPGADMQYLEDAVVCDGHIITSRGPGTAMDFGLKLIELLRGETARRQVEDGLQRPAA